MRMELADVIAPMFAHRSQRGPKVASKALAAISHALDRLLNWFIPVDIAADPQVVKQVRIFLISHLFGPFIGNVVPLTFYVLEPTPGLDVLVLFLSITGFWLFPFLLRAFGRYELLALLSVQNLIFCILWSCYFNGGVTSPTLTWVLTIPLLAFFYLGSAPRLCLFVLGLFAANLAAFYGLYLLGHVVSSDIPPASLQGLGIVSTAATSLYVIMMAVYYAKILASQAELEAEMRGHLATATELRRATAEAERADAAKSEFLAKMSHELRTPLNAVIGYSQILLEDAEAEGDAQSAVDLQKIHDAGHHLLRLVNEILDLSKIEAGKMELFNEQVDFAAIVRATAENCRALAEKNGNALIVELDPGLGIVTCDARKIQQAMMQLLDNAAKFTENGRIKVSAKRRARREGDEIVVDIQDTGIGIGRESIPSLFTNFTVANDSTSSKYGGTGLGLALGQKLCAMMGGEISVESELGVGSCFTIRLPASPPAPPVPAPREAQAEPSAARDTEADFAGGLAHLQVSI